MFVVISLKVFGAPMLAIAARAGRLLREKGGRLGRRFVFLIMLLDINLGCFLFTHRLTSRECWITPEPN